MELGGGVGDCSEMRFKVSALTFIVQSIKDSIFKMQGNYNEENTQFILQSRISFA